MNAKHRDATPPAQPLRPLRRRGAARVIAPAPAVEEPSPQIVERPDGFYWIAPDGKQEFGPFETAALARSDSEALDDEVPVPGETLQEAEGELGIAEWLDPDTGEPAEGLSPPHINPE